VVAGAVSRPEDTGQKQKRAEDEHVPRVRCKINFGSSSREPKPSLLKHFAMTSLHIVCGLDELAIQNRSGLMQVLSKLDCRENPFHSAARNISSGIQLLSDLDCYFFDLRAGIAARASARCFCRRLA
jgi:hypothetical protein